MIKYLISRFCTTTITLLVLYTVVFFLVRALPGSPWDSTKPLPPTVERNLRRYYGLDAPLWEQYSHYLWNIVSRGDFGPTYTQPDRTANDVLFDAALTSSQLGVVAMLLAVTGGLCLGIISALHRGKMADHLIAWVTSVGISIPEYVTTPLLILVLSLTLNLVPTSGWNGLFDSRVIVPILALSIRPGSSITRYTRNSMLDVLSADYIVAAHAKGLHLRTVTIKHAMRNALNPILTVIGTHTAFVITGSFYVEAASSIPGFASLYLQSILEREYPVIMGAVLIFGTFIALVNLCVDILYGLLDPRIRYK